MKKMVIALIVMSVAFSIISILVSYYYLPYDFSIGGRSITGTISLIVERSISFVIDHPLNTTYNFSIGDNYIISLNVSPRFDVQSWQYTLHDLRHNEIMNQSVIFMPNTTITAVRWNNNLTVYANNSAGSVARASVIFFVSVPNSAPLIRNMPNEYLACEDSSLYTYFNASDVDEDNLTASISPSGAFFVTSAMSNINLTWRLSDLFSGTLGKSNVGINSRTISVSDGSLSDSKNVNITVIGINHAPSVSNIGVHTIYSRGENSSFYYEVQVNDTEHGSNESSGNFTYNLTFLSGTRFLNITNGGVINGSANSSLVGVHSISVCVNDSGLSSPHANISSVCGTKGGSLISCVNFSVTVTDANRAPTITDYSPSDLTLSVNGNGSLISFNITKYDPDGTTPDTYWYFDNVFKEIDSGSLNDIFSVLFSTCVSESHKVKAVITDGLVNDSIQWNITVNPDVGCAPTVISGGGGGGGGGGGVAAPSCKALWGCATWSICDNLEEALKKGTLARDNYRELKERCTYAGFKESDCGYQKRVCLDVNNCNNTINKPEDTRVCYYTIAPSCSDKVKNCHDMDCEVLVDCGGPCTPCPTCSDNVQNQGEEKVDCGGPCTLCIEKSPILKLKKINYIVLILGILGVIAIVLIIRIIRFTDLLKSVG